LLLQLSDWYGITRKEITQRGGSALFNHYPSLEQALRTVYPDFPWQSMRFSDKQPKGHWADMKNQRELVEKIGVELGVKEVCKHNHISPHQKSIH